MIYISLIIFAPIGIVSFIYLSSWLNMPFASYLVSWGLFFILYIIASYGVCSITDSFKASFIASFAWFITKIGFVYYISYNQTYTTLYGSFAILFIVLFWVYLSWMIYLYGLKLTIQFQKYKDTF